MGEKFLPLYEAEILVGTCMHYIHAGVTKRTLF